MVAWSLLRAYADDKQFCVVNLLEESVQMTLKFSGNNAQLLLSYHKCNNPVSTATIGRWDSDKKKTWINLLN